MIIICHACRLSGPCLTLNPNTMVCTAHDNYICHACRLSGPCLTLNPNTMVFTAHDNYICHACRLSGPCLTLIVIRQWRHYHLANWRRAVRVLSIRVPQRGVIGLSGYCAPLVVHLTVLIMHLTILLFRVSLICSGLAQYSACACVRVCRSMCVCALACVYVCESVSEWVCVCVCVCVCVQPYNKMIAHILSFS